MLKIKDSNQTSTEGVHQSWESEVCEMELKKQLYSKQHIACDDSHLLLLALSESQVLH